MRWRPHLHLQPSKHCAIIPRNRPLHPSSSRRLRARYPSTSSRLPVPRRPPLLPLGPIARSLGRALLPLHPSSYAASPPASPRCCDANSGFRVSGSSRRQTRSLPIHLGRQPVNPGQPYGTSTSIHPIAVAETSSESSCSSSRGVRESPNSTPAPARVCPLSRHPLGASHHV